MSAQPSLSTTDARALAEASEALLETRKYEQALNMADRALAAEPRSARAHCLRCRALLSLERYREAADAGWQAVGLAPNWAFPHRLLSVCLRKQAVEERRPSLMATAVAQARCAVSLSPNEPASHVSLAEACSDNKQEAEADEAARRAITLAPQSASVWLTASYVALRSGNWKAAEQAARAALAIEPNSPAASNNLGVALRRRGRWATGAVAFAQAARIDPRSSKALDNLELVGFSYLARAATVLLLPLLVVPPAFLAARLAVGRYLLEKRPARLAGLARRIGLKVASSKRHRARFQRAAERAGAQARPHVGRWSARPSRWQPVRETAAAVAFMLAWAAAVLFLFGTEIAVSLILFMMVALSACARSHRGIPPRA